VFWHLLNVANRVSKSCFQFCLNTTVCMPIQPCPVTSVNCCLLQCIWLSLRFCLMISWLPIYSVIDARNQYVCDLLCEYMKQRLRYGLEEILIFGKGTHCGSSRCQSCEWYWTLSLTYYSQHHNCVFPLLLELWQPQHTDFYDCML
jgi:hypothetical protein